MELVETVSLWEGGVERNGARCSGWYEGRGGEAERKKRAESAVSIRVDGATERLVNGRTHDSKTWTLFFHVFTILFRPFSGFYDFISSLLAFLQF